MTVAPGVDPARLLEEQLSQASPDLLRELLGTFLNTLLSAAYALVLRVREGGRVVLVHARVATGINALPTTRAPRDPHGLTHTTKDQSSYTTSWDLTVQGQVEPLRRRPRIKGIRALRHEQHR